MLRLILLACLSVLALPTSAQQAPSQSESADAQRADTDAMINVAVRMASDSQAYYLKPVAFGGGANSFDGLSFTALEYPVNETGEYVLRSDDGAGVQTYTMAETDGVVTITSASNQHDKVVRVTVSGPKVDDISVSVSRRSE